MLRIWVFSILKGPVLVLVWKKRTHFDTLSGIDPGMFAPPRPRPFAHVSYYRKLFIRTHIHSS